MKRTALPTLYLKEEREYYVDAENSCFRNVHDPFYDTKSIDPTLRNAAAECVFLFNLRFELNDACGRFFDEEVETPDHVRRAADHLEDTTQIVSDRLAELEEILKSNCEKKLGEKER